MCTENVDDSYCPNELECCGARSAHVTRKEYELAAKPHLYINPGSIEKHLLK